METFCLGNLAYRDLFIFQHPPSGKAVFLSSEIPELTYHSSNKRKGITAVRKAREALPSSGDASLE